jgi:metacaspase-1
MTAQTQSHVFLAYASENQEIVEALARRLQGDARLSFWFGPWHSIPGVLIQEQMEEALKQAQSCAIFIGGAEEIAGWQNMQMRTAIQTCVEDDPNYRVIPVLLPDASDPKRHDLPSFLRRYEMVKFRSLDDEQAFNRLLAGIYGIPPIQVDSYIQAKTRKEHIALPPSGRFEHGRAIVIGIANYLDINPLPEIVLNDARNLQALLTDPAVCGYPSANITLLLDEKASGNSIRTAMTNLAASARPDDTVIIFFSGHGAHSSEAGNTQQYIMPYDCNRANISGTAISGNEMTGMLRAIHADRLLVLFDSCHSGGAGEPKGWLPQMKTGLSEDYYQILGQGRGRIVIASSRPDELSWTLPGMQNSLFTHYLLEALHGRGRTLGDGYVRVFDLFRHVSQYVPSKANEAGIRQHPIFKATIMEEDFPIALTAAGTY